MAEAIVSGLRNVQISPHVIQDTIYFHKIITVALIWTWWSLMAVKLCFLCLFKKLVNRIKHMLVYWWIVIVFNLLVAAYGTSSYIAACPHFTDRKYKVNV